MARVLNIRGRLASGVTVSGPIRSSAELLLGRTTSDATTRSCRRVDKQVCLVHDLWNLQRERQLQCMNEAVYDNVPLVGYLALLADSRLIL